MVLMTLDNVGTGQDANGLLNDFWRYDPSTNTWSTVSSFPGTARRQAVGFAMGGQGYVGTGDDGAFTKDFYQYEPTTDTWTQKSDFTGTPRYGASGFGIFPTAFIGTGYDNTLAYTKDFWEYNYFSDTWVQRMDFAGTARANAAAFAVGGAGYIGTGYDGQLLDDFYQYTPILSDNELREQDISAYPNPCTNQLFVESEESFDQVQIFDVKGRLISTKAVRNRRVEIEVGNLIAGNYVYVVTKGNTVLNSGRFVKN